MPNTQTPLRPRWPDPALSPLPHPSWARPSTSAERAQRVTADEFWNRLGL